MTVKLAVAESLSVLLIRKGECMTRAEYQVSRRCLEQQWLRLKWQWLLRVAALVCVCLWSMTVAVAADQPVVDRGLEQVDVFISGQDGYHTYRIPSVIVTNKGTVLAFCEGRKRGRGDSGDIDLLLKRSEDGGRTFSTQQIVWDDADNTCGNPCPVVDRQSGTIFLLMTHNLGSDTEEMIAGGKSKGTRTVWICYSTDDGKTFSKPQNLTHLLKKPDWTWYATGPGAGIQLGSGRLLVPCDHKEAQTKVFRSHVVYSDDRGKTWKLGGIVGSGTNECEAVELADGSVMLNMRNYNRKYQCRAVAISKDGGQNFGEVYYDQALVEPVCQASIRRYSLPQGGRPGVILFSNPASTNKREKLTVRASFDEGKTWPISRIIHEGPAAYSCLAVGGDGTIYCLYERGEESPYEKITLARLSLGWLMEDKGQ